MILCWCCEVRVGHSFDPCGCAAEYHWECGRCEAHCPCAPVPHVVRDATPADRIDPPPAGGEDG